MGGKTWKAIRRKLRDEKGATLVIAAGSMLAITSVAALAIDVGMLVTARTEAQRVADGAALAGAGGLALSPGNAVLARYEAVDYGTKNAIRGELADVRPEDVDVDLANERVTVRVYRTRDRGNPVGTFFARMFGVNAVNVSTRAVAEASFAGAISCPLPVAVPDRWYEAGGPHNDPQGYNPEYGDYYLPWQVPGSDPPQYNTDYTGYGQQDIGTEFVLKSNAGGGGLNRSWYYPWRPWEDQGADDYRYNVQNCVDTSKGFYVGMSVTTEPGNMTGPTLQGFEDLIAQDPNASWNVVNKCVVDAGLEYSSDPSHCRSSPRIRPLPMFDPTQQPELGTKPFTFTNFAGVFVQDVKGQNVVAVWTGYTGIKPATGEIDATAGPLFRVLRLMH
jgi:hypothetical protein